MSASSFSSFLSPPPLVELDALQTDIESVLKLSVKTINVVSRDGLKRVFHITTENKDTLVVHMPLTGIPSSSLQSEVATLDYIRSHTTLPVPRILYTNYARTDILKPYIILEKIEGPTLESIWPTLAPFEQDLIIGQLARYMLEIFTLRFDRIGSLYPVLDNPGEVLVGSLITPPFYVAGRVDYPLDRGPFVSAKSYFSACAQREVDCARFSVSPGAGGGGAQGQDTSASYQKKVEEERVNVERSMSLFQRLIDRCEGLDELDPDLAPFSLDVHHCLGMKNITVSNEDNSQIVALDFHHLTTMPLWCCARLPSWLAPSILYPQPSHTGELEIDKDRLSNVFRQTITGVEGYHSVFLRGIDSEDTRHALVDLSVYDAFKDSFLLIPALESIAATLPGEEDIEGLRALLDPSTLEGRVARISLMTRGPDVMALAMPIEESSFKATGAGPLGGGIIGAIGGEESSARMREEVMSLPDLNPPSLLDVMSPLEPPRGLGPADYGYGDAYGYDGDAQAYIDHGDDDGHIFSFEDALQGDPLDVGALQGLAEQGPSTSTSTTTSPLRLKKPSLVHQTHSAPLPLPSEVVEQRQRQSQVQSREQSREQSQTRGQLQPQPQLPPQTQLQLQSQSQTDQPILRSFTSPVPLEYIKPSTNSNSRLDPTISHLHAHANTRIRPSEIPLPLSPLSPTSPMPMSPIGPLSPGIGGMGGGRQRSRSKSRSANVSRKSSREFYAFPVKGHAVGVGQSAAPAAAVGEVSS